MSVRYLLQNVKSSFPSTRSASSAVATAYDVLKNNGEVSSLTPLTNGFRVASHTNQRPIATVGLWIDSGARYENSDNSGVGSLFEHLVHTGTSKRNATQLQVELAKMGARLNSFVNRDHAAYYIECMSGDVEKVVAILADVVGNANFNQDKIEEQKSILLKKIEERESDYRATVDDYLHKTAFQGTGYSLPPLGSASSVEVLTKQDIEHFVDDHCKAIRMVLTGVGGVNHDQLCNLGEKHFGKLGNTYKRKVPDPHAMEAVRFSGSELMFRNDSSPAVYGAIAVEGVRRNHPDYFALQVASAGIGQHDPSHASSVNSPNKIAQLASRLPGYQGFENFSLSYNNTGLFGVYLVSSSHDAGDMFELKKFVQDEWKHLACSVTEPEVNRHKNALKSNLYLKIESNTDLAHHIATEVLNCGEITPLHELEHKIDQINSSTVRAALSRFIYDRDVASVAIGQTELWPDYFNIRSGMSWWRL